MCKTVNVNCGPAQAKATPRQRIERSYKRAKKLTSMRNKNLSYYRQVFQYLNELPGLEENSPQDEHDTRHYLDKYRQRLITCASDGLYRVVNGGRECSLITAHTCNHRLCNVCNMLRSRKLRRKWRNFLTDSEANVPVKAAQAHMWGIAVDGKVGVDTATGEIISRDENKAFTYTSGAELLQKFDLMHLTLTVPHENGTWNGKDYYAQELLEKFNVMRKADWWVDNVFGGEYTVETTNNADGLHIHIHAMLFVAKFPRNRNFLAKEILLRWNALTVDKGSSKEKLLEEKRRDGVAAGFKNLSENELNDLLLDLDGRGSTMVGLNTLYYEIPAEEYAMRTTGIWEKDGRYYSRCRTSHGNGTSETTINSIVKGVIECLKYHFEPCVMEDSEGRLNMPLIAKVLPNIYRQRLYGKFGGFYGVKQLNVIEEPVTAEDILEDTVETATEAFDPRTGLEMQPNEYFYAIADARSICFDADKNRPYYYLNRSKIKRRISAEEAPSLRAAVMSLVHRRNDK